MCGILGCFAFGDARPDPHLWSGLVELLGHRGPDDGTIWHDGRFVFGHRRLSIIDLSLGHQPMSTDDGSLVVTFNGEIYNYIELRRELTARGHRFRTQSDTEVLLHGYREWGDELPAKLRGMFAFAIADRARQELFAARDRFGEKPFVYAEENGGIAFASEVKVLAAIPHRHRELNEQVLPAYLSLNYVPGDDTMLRGVVRLKPGSWRRWTASGAVHTGTYWQPPDPHAPDLDTSFDDAIGQLEHLLDDATRLALRSDVPVGIFLSGGIDSSLVAHSATRSGRISAAYCLTFSEASYSEWPRAQETARQLGIPLVEVQLTAHALADFTRIVAHADDPLADSSSLAVWTLSREVAGRHKVVLSGDGGDELFGGYLTYPATIAHETITSRLPMTARRLIASVGARLPTTERKVSSTYKVRRFLRAADLPAGVAHFTWNGTWLPREAAALMANPSATAVESIARLANAHGLSGRPGIRELQAADVKDYLPNDILAKSDRMSMAHGLEVRAPFLDAALAEFALRLPAALKVTRRGETKRILRELARRTCGPAVSRAPKQGFSIPVHSWLRGPARHLIEDLLSPASLTALPLDAARVSRAVNDHMSGRRSFGFELWGLAVLVAWHRLYIQRSVTMPESRAPRLVEIPSPAAHKSVS
jgi:asparagine synthase (glutamine-hydrolysing)